MSVLTLPTSGFCLAGVKISFQSKCVEPVLRRVSADGCQQLFDLERLIQKTIRATLKTGLLHLCGRRRADDEHL